MAALSLAPPPHGAHAQAARGLRDGFAFGGCLHVLRVRHLVGAVLLERVDEGDARVVALGPVEPADRDLLLLARGEHVRREGCLGDGDCGDYVTEEEADPKKTLHAHPHIPPVATQLT
jgi:hypothetical protein